MGFFPQNFPTMNTTPNTFFLYSLKAYCLMEKENCIAKVQNTMFSNIQPKNFKRRHKIWFLNCYLIILRIKFSLKISSNTIKHLKKISVKFKKYFKEKPFLIISADKKFNIFRQRVLYSNYYIFTQFQGYTIFTRKGVCNLIFVKLWRKISFSAISCNSKFLTWYSVFFFFRVLRFQRV